MRKRPQRGGTLVEGALIIVVFFGFLMAIVEFGRAYNIHQVVTNAAREGARVGAAPCSLAGSNCKFPDGSSVGPGASATGSEIKSVVRTYLRTAGMDPAAQASKVNVAVCNKASCDSGFIDAPQLPCTVLNPAVQSLETCFVAVKVTAPYSFLFFKDLGTVNISSEARMRDEANSAD